MGAIFRKDCALTHFQTRLKVERMLEVIAKETRRKEEEVVDLQLFFIFFIFFFFSQNKVEEEQEQEQEKPQFLLSFFLICFFSQKEIVDSKKLAFSKDGGDESTKTLNLGVLCALRAGDKESFIKRISNDGTFNQHHVDNIQGNSILHLAAALGHVHIVEYIAFKFRNLVNKENLMGETVLHVAARAGHGNVVEFLIKQKREFHLISAKSKNGDNPVHAALKGKHAHVAFYLVNERHYVSFDVNNDQVSPLYLAVEAGYYNLVERMLRCSCCPFKLDSTLSVKSVVHAAMRSKRTDILGIVLSQDPRFVKLRDKEGRTCLSLGASIGFYEGVCYLFTEFDKPASHLCYLADDDGFTPIHMAAKEGHVEIIKEFLKHCPDSVELLNNQCQNILHVAAKNGKSKVVKYLIGLGQVQKRMVNEQDVDGNTPLHLATKNWHPKVVSMLTWNDGVKLKTLNNGGFTALDIAEKSKNKGYILRRRLTWMALVSAGAQNGPKLIPLNVSQDCKKYKKCEYTEKFKDRINTLMVIATLVATVTFAAGFTLPGGYISSAPDLGMAVLVKKTAFKVFLLCNSIAMLSSMVTIMALIWAQLGDVVLIEKAFKVALPLLATALVSMSVAFMSGVCLVISHLPWLAYFILAIDSVFLLALLLLIIAYVFSYPSQGYRRYIFYFPFFLMLLALSDEEDSNNNNNSGFKKCSVQKPFLLVKLFLDKTREFKSRVRAKISSCKL